jgi:outer membrane protein assembly factor BamB
VRSYDLANGQEFWRLHWGLDITESTPVCYRDSVIFSSGKGRNQPVVRISLSARGDITPDLDADSNESVPWLVRKGGPITTSPLVYRDRVYTFEDLGSCNIFSAETGRLIYKCDVSAEQFFASPVASNGWIYIPSLSGNLYAIKAGTVPAEIHKIPLDGRCFASPALAGRHLILRTTTTLLALDLGSNP